MIDSTDPLLSPLSIAPDPAFGLRQPFSAGSHLLGFALAIFVALALWRLTRGDSVKRIALSVFSLCLIALYAASGTYHAVTHSPEVIDFFRRLDHSAIYLLIAGSYTPVYAILLRGPLRIAMLVMIWSMALTGITLKWAMPFGNQGITLGLYVAMGWLGGLPIWQLFRAVGPRAMLFVFAGGGLYTLGGVCDACHWPYLWQGVVHPHEVLHLCDLAATTIHTVFIFRYVLPFPREG